MVSGQKAEISQSESKDWEAPPEWLRWENQGRVYVFPGFSYQLPLGCYHLRISFREGAFPGGFENLGVGSFLLTPKKGSASNRFTSMPERRRPGCLYDSAAAAPPQSSHRAGASPREG